MADPTPPPSQPPPPPAPGGPSPSSASPPPSLSTRIGNSRGFRFASGAWRYKGLVAGGLSIAYAALLWESEKRKAHKRDAIHDNTYLYWKIYDGGIVEAKSAGSNLNYLLSSQNASPHEPPRVMELFDVIRTIKFIESDDRIRGIIADFSSTSVPSVPSYNLGLAQLEEVQDALLELRRVKQEKFGTEGPGGWRTVAWTDTFTGQGQFLLASTFDEIYMQPTGEVPLVGMGSTTPFFGRLAKWLGIEVHAEARNEYKSFVQPYIDEQLTPPQRENHRQLLSDLNDNLLTYLARNRFPHLVGQRGLDRAKELSHVGPFTASRAKEAGLIDGLCYRQDVIDSVVEEEAQLVGAEAAAAPAPALTLEQGAEKDAAQEGQVVPASPEPQPPKPPTLDIARVKDDKGNERKLMGFYHYAKVVERAMEKYLNDAIDVGVVYLQGTIGDPGEFGTASVVRGLKEAGEDETIGAVVLRIDSGGGSVVDSDTIWGAVRELREKKGKTVVASFGNSSASGGYLVSTHTDAIFAAPSTVTGSIGVAALRPTFTQRFFDRLHLTLEHLYLGSRAHDVTHALTGDELARHKAHVDDMYDDFKGRVCSGRAIDPSVIEGIAGGRVMTGLRAFEMNAPEELIRQIKGLEVVEGEGEGAAAAQVMEVGSEGPAKEVAQAASAAKVDAAESHAVAILPAEQETSSFAVPEVIASAAESSLSVLPHSPNSPSAADSITPSDPAAANATAAASTASTAEAAAPGSTAAAGALNGAAGLYEYEAGPYGRGLIDGLGGLRDAAISACQLFIANGIAGYKEQNPEVTDQEAIKTLLPDAKFVQADGGELAMQVDVRLKRFPLQKSFWQQLADASRRGDSMSDQLSLALLPSLSALKAAVARSFLGAVADSVVGELNLSSSSGTGVGAVAGTATPWLNAARGWARGGVRAEWEGARGRWV
ncbi:hypothetical protein JCM10207_000827 [Rhodosporidiobolus poonsookiae]